jgi:uncharacterized membrane protein YhaH (DUF805 family)
MASLISDPLGRDSDLFGTAAGGIDHNPVSANAVWHVEVAALVIGHAAGLTLVRDRAPVEYRRMRDAVRSQYWTLAVMVPFTTHGLWLLSASAQA